MVKSSYDPVALGLEVVRQMSGDEYSVKCPYHDDTHPSAEYNAAKGLFYCFSCHVGKSAEQVAKDLDGTLIPIAAHGFMHTRKSMAVQKEWLDIYIKNGLAIGNNYLIGRGVGAVQISKFRIKTSTDGIIFPIHDKFDKLTGLQIRRYDGKPKYMIYGERQPIWPLGIGTTIPNSGKLFIVEGVFGVLRADKFGVSAVAIMGSGNVEESIAMIKHLPSNVYPYAIMDPDYAGLLAAGKFVLSGIPVMIGHKIAPDEWDRDQWLQVKNLGRTMAARSVMDVIEVLPPGFKRAKLRQQLEKYWSKINV